MRVEIPENLRERLGADMKMDVHWIDVKLRDGRVMKNLVARGRRYITGQSRDADGEGEVPFSTTDIQNIRRHSIFPFW